MIDIATTDLFPSSKSERCTKVLLRLEPANFALVIAVLPRAEAPETSDEPGEAA